MRMIEKVARAIANGTYDHPDTESDERRAYRQLAVDVLKAMREPNEVMEKAAYSHDDSGAQLSCAYDEIYTVMIDAALNE